MNKYYLIVPVALLIVFSLLYSSAYKEMEVKHQAQIAEKARKTAEDDARKKIIDDKATAEARQRQEAAAALTKAKEEKKQKDYEDGMKKLSDETTDYTTQADKMAKDAADLEIQISQNRTEKEKLNRETLELSKQVELAKINRRTAEIEIQRQVEIVGRKLNESSIAVPPPPPPLVAK